MRLKIKFILSYIIFICLLYVDLIWAHSLNQCSSTNLDRNSLTCLFVSFTHFPINYLDSIDVASRISCQRIYFLIDKLQAHLHSSIVHSLYHPITNSHNRTLISITHSLKNLHVPKQPHAKPTHHKKRNRLCTSLIDIDPISTSITSQNQYQFRHIPSFTCSHDIKLPHTVY